MVDDADAGSQDVDVQAQDVTIHTDERTSHDSEIFPPLFSPVEGGPSAASSLATSPHPLAPLALHHGPLTSTGSLLTESSGSTVPGIGMYSGRVVNRVGQAIIHVAEEFKIRKRLRQLNRIFTAKEEDQRIAFYRNVSELLSAIDDLNELSGRPNRSISLSKTGYPRRIVREALSTMNNVIGLGATYTKYDMSPEDRLLLILYIADSYWILTERSSILRALQWMLDLISVLGPRRNDNNSDQMSLYQPTYRCVLQAVCDAMAAAPKSLADYPILSSLTRFFRKFLSAKYTLLPLDRHLGFIQAFLQAVLEVIRKSTDNSMLANAYDMVSILSFEMNSSKSLLSEEDGKSLQVAGRNTAALHDVLYVFDQKAVESFDLDGPHAAKEVTSLIKRQLYRNSFFSRARRPHVQHETLFLLSQLIKRKKKQALLHYKVPDILWECLADLESDDWLNDLDIRIIVIRGIADIMSAFSEERPVFDKIANTWLRRKTSLVQGKDSATSELGLCCFAVSALSGANKRFGELYLRDSGLIEYLSDALCKPWFLTAHHQRFINNALIALLNYSWAPALILLNNVPDFLVKNISFKADNSSSMEALQDWASADLDLLGHLYRRGSSDIQTAVRKSYDSCKYNQHTVAKMKLFRAVMKSIISEKKVDFAGTS